MFRNLLGTELSHLRFALMCSYVGGILLMATGLIFALPSIFIEFTNDAPDFSTFAWILVVVGVARLISTYLYAMGKKFFYYIIMVGVYFHNFFFIFLQKIYLMPSNIFFFKKF